MRCRRSSAAGRQRGAALIVAMLVFALCTALIVAMKGEFTLFYQRGANLFVSEQAYAYLRGAEELAAAALLRDYDEDFAAEALRDDLSELWAQQATYPLEDGGWLTGGLEDLQGRFNLNTLMVAESETGERTTLEPAQEQFIRLLLSFEELEVDELTARMLTESIADWLDADKRPRADGAEDDYYSSLTPAYRTADRGVMSSVSELRLVANITPEIYQALLPWVTVWPQANDALMNVHTAPMRLLRTINEDGNLAPLSEEEVSALVEQRADTGFEDIEAFLASSVFSDKVLDKIRERLGESSEAFLLSAETEVADRRVRLYSVLQREGRKVNALTRASGSL